LFFCFLGIAMCHIILILRFLRVISKIKTIILGATMKKFYIGENKYLELKIPAYYNCEFKGCNINCKL